MRTILHSLSKKRASGLPFLLVIGSFFFCLTTLNAQVVLNVNSAQGAQNVEVDITVENFENINGVQFTMDWDPAYLSMDSVGNFGLPGLDQFNFGGIDNVLGQLTFSWFDLDLSGESLTDGSVMFSMYFEVLQAGDSDICLTDTPTLIEIVDVGNNVLPYMINCGAANGVGTTLVGNVFHDLNDDCAMQGGENGLENWVLKLNGNQNFYTSTDADGDFSIFVDTGSYVIELMVPSGIWVACDNLVDVELDGTVDPYELDFPVRSIVDCPLMSVDVSTPFLRRCFTNTYHVDYCNIGTVDAVDPYVEIEFDEYLLVTGSSVSYSMIDEGVYSFDIESLLEVGECGSFTVEAILDCDSTILGQTHCVTAHAFPDSLCIPPPVNWSGASLQIDGKCEGGEVRFTIENIGEDMDNESQYIVIEDAVMHAPNNFILPSGGSMPVVFPANGATYRFEVMQVEDHPGNSMPSIAVEGCGTNNQGDFSIGFVNQFSEDDIDPWISIDCQESIGSYDPNDKAAFPQGYDNQHFVKPNIDLEYKIRFQNTGTDTAFTVVIEDTLSTFLDPATVRPGASSHPYDFELTGQGLLRFTFNNIMLPDSNVNEVASHGFVKFKIAQNPELPNGTIINNEAAIYFDFNEAVWTNQTFHEVQREFVTVNTQQVYVENVDVKVFPNPFTESTTFKIEGQEFGELTLQIYDTYGRLISSQQFDNQSFELKRKNLQQGLYFYEISNSKGLISTGKILAQ